jgi:hypothetical protein
MLWMLVEAAGDDFVHAAAPAEHASEEPDGRPAWADDADVDLELRHGPIYTYLRVVNRRSSPYSGMLAYRAPDGDVLHLHAGIGAGRAGLVMLNGDEVAGVAFDGDASEGGWLARGLSTSVVFSGGAAGVIPCADSGLLLVAPESGRFQLRRGMGWPKVTGYRLLLNGRLLPASLRIDATHLLVPYVAEDEQGQTDMYLVLRNDQELPIMLRGYLSTLLAARAAALNHAVALATPAKLFGGVATMLAEVATRLVAQAARLATLGAYDLAWRDADARAGEAIRALEMALNAQRRSWLTGALDITEYERRAARITRSMRLVSFAYQAG